MTYKEILAQGPERIAKLSFRELRSQVRKLGNAANRRLDRLAAAGLSTPATYDSFTGKSMSRILASGKNLNELRSEFARAALFLNAQTSSVSGARKWRRDVISGLESAGVTGITAENFNTLWQSYEKLKDMDASVQSRGLKYKVLKEIEREISEGNSDANSIANSINRKLVIIYEQQEEERNKTAAARGLDIWTADEEEEE